MRIVSDDGFFNKDLHHKYVMVITAKGTYKGIVTEAFEEVISVQIDDEERKTLLVDIDDLKACRAAVLVLGRCYLIK
jgi:hypothetical protein